MKEKKKKKKGKRKKGGSVAAGKGSWSRSWSCWSRWEREEDNMEGDSSGREEAGNGAGR